ncbi:MAG: hypothetical protein GX448_18225 [Planctomycetes bacterium]|nr:hypothetical protein [Planctomycetota bacterium]
MKTRSCAILVALVVVSGGIGCSRHVAVVRKSRPVHRVAQPQAEWGPLAGGLQCRLRPVKRAYPPGESPAFKVDLSNRGSRVFAFIQSEQAPLDRFAIDGRWKPWPSRPPTDGKTLALGPGVEFTELPAVLPADAQSSLTAGPHTIQVAFSFEGIEVVSNPVEIEIIGQP